MKSTAYAWGLNCSNNVHTSEGLLHKSYPQPGQRETLRQGEARLRSLPARCACVQNHNTKADARQAGRVGGLGLCTEAEKGHYFHKVEYREFVPY